MEADPRAKTALKQFPEKGRKKEAQVWTREQLEEREIPDVAHCKQTGHDAGGVELSPGHHRTVLGQVWNLIMALPWAFMPQSFPSVEMDTIRLRYKDVFAKPRKHYLHHGV